MQFNRIIYSQIQNSLSQSDDIIILFGARQVGKTSLCQVILAEYIQAGKKAQYFQCESELVQHAFATNNIEAILDLIGDYDLVILDEAQSIADIGWRLKLIADYNQFSSHKIKVIATGSSSFELANQINEPLTGRAEQYYLFPLSLSEIKQQNSRAEIRHKLAQILVFGMYPSIFDQSQKTISKEIQKIFNNYLYKDILTFENIKKSSLLKDLTKLLALQIGQETSLNSLAQKLNVSIATIDRYLNLLEQTFIIFKLKTLNRNSAKEITRNFKVYFYDLGVRNFIINNFNPIEMRTDIGALWENFCVVEKVKKNYYENNDSNPANMYFWRTYDQAEIDLVEEKNGQFDASECKFSPNKKAKIPIEFARSYNPHTFTVIHSENFVDFLL
jgi:uncharacterized protein